MKVKKSTYAKCRALASALQSNSEEALVELIESLGLEGLSDPELLTLARASSSNGVVVLLSTILTENEIEQKKSSLILAAYTSIIKKQIQPLIQQIGGRNPISYVIKALISPDKEIKPFRDHVNITPDLLLAIEIAIDYKAPKLALNLIKAFVSSSPNLYEIQTVISSLALRNDLQPDFLSWGDFADCWLELLKQFDNSDDEHAKQHIKTFIANALGSAGRVEECLAYCDQITEEEFVKTALFISIKTLTGSHRFREAIARLKVVAKKLELDEGKETDKTIELDVEAESKKYQTEFDIEAAHIALEDLYKILDPIGVKPFLVSGTLLGYARNKEFLPHDKDIDVGVFANVDKLKIFEEIFKSGKFILDCESLTRDPLYTIAVTHIQKGICIDIFFYHDKGDQYVTGVNYDWNFDKCFAFSKFDIKKITFSGIEAYIPEDYELNLAENFGPDWKIEDKNYISHLESPSGVAKGSDVYMLLLWIHLVQSINKGNKEKLKKVWDLSQNYSDNELAPTREYFEDFIYLPAAEGDNRLTSKKELSYAI
jgi:hypothetical protein